MSDMAEDDGATRIQTGPARSEADAPTVAPGSRPSASPGPPAEAGLLPVGSRLGEFEVTRIVGQGGFGVVYEAWDPTLERVVAIKEYLPTSLSTRQLDGTVMPLSERHRETFDLGMRSFINEARLLAQFDHPSLLKVYRFWQERGTTYMVMPFYRGDTLRQALAARSGAVDEGWLLHIMDGVTQALAVMHAAHCYHRDIAPDNIILLEGSGRPVVLDFGAARRVITDKTQAITVILKPGYAPIEQYAEMPDMSQGAWTDVYALAAVMHVAVTGRAPPPSVARLLADSYQPLIDNEALRQRYSLGLLAAIDSGLGVRPESRPQSMGALRAALGLDGGATVIRPTVMPTPMQAGGQPGGGAASGAWAKASTTPSAPSASTASATGTTTATRTTPAALPMPASAPAGRGIAIAAAAVLLIAGAGGAWWWTQGRTDETPRAAATAAAPTDVAQAPAASSSSATTGGPAASSTASTAPSAAPSTAPSTAPPAPPPARPRTPLESLQSLTEGAAPGFNVKATPVKADVVTGKDKLGFEVRSSREGFVYVYLLSSGGELFLLFPNLLDKYNKIAAGATLSLPRASWPMNAGGPSGVNRFAVLVSERERDFGESGIRNDGVFPQFSLPVLSALEAARGTNPPPLLGKPVCDAGARCNDVYGVATFNITEKDR